MKRSKSVWGIFVLATLLLILFWTSYSSKSQGGSVSGLHLKDVPPSTQTAVVQPQARASNLILVEFFAGY
jgi:hypothetical protein